MADETQEERDQRVREEGEQAAKEYDSWAEENDLPTNEEIEAARDAGRQSGLYFGTGTGTSVGDFPLNTADSLQKATAINEAIANDEAITVDTQPGGATTVGTTDDISDEERQALSDANIRDSRDPEQVGSEDAHVQGSQPSVGSVAGANAQASRSSWGIEDVTDTDEGADANTDEGDSTRTAKEIKADIESADSTERVDELAAEGADFKTVRDAADRRRQELSESDDSDEDDVTGVYADNPDSITVEHDGE